MVLNTNLILNGAQLAGNVFSFEVVGLTKAFNEVVGSTSVDFYMDSVSGYGHRILHGHSLEYLPSIFSEYGTAGVWDGLIHWLRDVSSVHGVPVPFANEVRSFFGLNLRQTTDWLCLNTGDVVGGVFALWHTYSNFKIVSSNGELQVLSILELATIGFGAITKVCFGFALHNPITLFCGLMDGGLMLWAVLPSIRRSFFLSDETKALVEKKKRKDILLEATDNPDANDADSHNSILRPIESWKAGFRRMKTEAYRKMFVHEKTASSLLPNGPTPAYGMNVE